MTCHASTKILCDVTAAMLVYRTVTKKVFWEFDSNIMQNLNDILPLFCTRTWPSYPVRENQEQKAPRKIAAWQEGHD